MYLCACSLPTKTFPRGNKSQANKESKKTVHLDQAHKDELHGAATSTALLLHTGHEGPSRAWGYLKGSLWRLIFITKKRRKWRKKMETESGEAQAVVFFQRFPWYPHPSLGTQRRGVSSTVAGWHYPISITYDFFGEGKTGFVTVPSKKYHL